MEISSAYWHELTKQTIFISALLGGFSLNVVVALLRRKRNDRIYNNIFRSGIIATASFLISIFSMTNIYMLTAESSPLKYNPSKINLLSLIGTSTLFLGIIALLIIISLSGWTKSKGMGIFTSIIGILSFFFIMFTLV